MDPQTARPHLATAGAGHPAVRTSSQTRWLAVVVGILLLEFGLTAGRLHLAAATAPVVVGPTQAGFNLIVLPDGALELYDVRADAGGKRLIRARSNDYGRTWTEPETLRQLPIHGGVVALLDRRGEVQLFVQVLRTEGDGKRIAVNRFIDIWQLQSSGSRRQWSESQRIFEGYVGSVQGALQLRNGRIILPFAYWLADRPQGPPTHDYARKLWLRASQSNMRARALQMGLIWFFMSRT